MQIPKNASQSNEKTCKTCQITMPNTLKYFPGSKIGRKVYLGRKCKKCVQKSLQSAYKSNGRRRLRHKTRMTEKAKAYERDKKCIYPGCKKTTCLDFHHAFSKPLDKLPKEADWNAYTYGVMLCRPHHKEVKTNQRLYEYCKTYIRLTHPGDQYLQPVTEEENKNFKSFHQDTAHA